MSAETSIEWTDVTWNPVRGCSRVSEGCRNCYAERIAGRFSGPGQAYEGLARGGAHDYHGTGAPRTNGSWRWTGEIRCLPEALEEPLRWKKPRRVFVNSMSDLFHEKVPDKFIAAVFGVMAAASQHTFQVLTKRPERALRWFGWLEEMAERCTAVFDEDPAEWRRAHVLRAAGLYYGVLHKVSAGDIEARGWPLPNVWLGVSVEDQERAGERIPDLLAAPAAVRFLSCEPLLGPIDLQPTIAAWARALSRGEPAPGRIGWVIIGGESGPHARPCRIEWVRSLVAQCRAAKLPVFVKQLGARPVMDVEAWRALHPTPLLDARGRGLPDDLVQLAMHGQKGKFVEEWPAELRVRQWPEISP